MAKLIDENQPLEVRRQLVESNAESIEEREYFKQLSQEELELRLQSLAENAVRFDSLEDEKKDFMSNLKAQMDPLKTEKKRLLTEWKTKQAKITGKLFSIPNLEDSMMEVYDEDGLLVSSRRLRPEEKQMNVFPLKRAQ